MNLGHSPYELRKAARAGRLIRPRLGWVALPDADPQLVFAARHRVVLTCITQAARLGLWVLEHDRPHVSAHRSDHKTAVPDAVVHWRRPLVLRSPGQLADGVENLLDCVASCQPYDAALAIWDSALQKRLIDIQALQTLPWRGKAQALLSEATPFSDSGLESMFRTRLRWLNLPIRYQTWLCGHRVDFLIGERLVVQIDGKQHEGAQRASDRRHDAELMLRGYTIIRVGYSEVVHEWEKVQGLILDAIARGQHLAR